MRLNSWLKQAEAQLQASGIATARLDCLVLLEDVLNTNRTHILAEPDRQLTDTELDELTGLITKRARHIPLAYVRGKTEFYSREFIVNEHVLEPRPESETMIDLLKAVSLELTAQHQQPDLEDGPRGPSSRSSSKSSGAKMRSRQLQIADIGTGSGALAITAQLELPDAIVRAVDIDEACLQVAHRNARKHQVDITFLTGDLLAPLPTFSSQPSVLLCNLPYVPDDFHINTAATHEPKLAIFGGPDGLDIYRRLFAQADTLRIRPSYIFTESLPPQHGMLADIAGAHGYRQDREADFIQLFVANA